MAKSILSVIAIYFALLAAALLISPQGFYDTVPGVSDTGAFNSHFMRDVGLAFLASAAALGVGAMQGNRALALFGAGFPALHGGYHALHWLDHGGALNGAVLMELVVTSGLGLLTVVVALRIRRTVA